MGRAVKIVLLASTSLIMSVQLHAWAQGSYVGPAILPPAPGAIDGGNPLQGLGRSDDPGASREKQYGFPTYNSSGFNANGEQNYPAPSFYSEFFERYPQSNSSNSSSGSVFNNSNLSDNSANGFNGNNANNPVANGNNAGSTGQAGNSNSSNFPGGFIPTSMLDSPATNSSPNAVSPGAGQSGAGPGATAAPNQDGQNFAPGFTGQAGFGIPGSGAGYQLPGNGSPGFSTNGYNDSTTSNANSESNSGFNYNTAAPTQVPFPPSAQTALASPTYAAQAPVPSDSIQSPAVENKQGSIFQTNKKQPANQSQPGNGKNSDINNEFNHVLNSGLNGGANKGPNPVDSAVLPSNLNTLPQKAELVPPPPPAYYSNAGDNSTKLKAPASPLARVIDQIKVGRLPEALINVNNVLHTDAKNADAHYLKAVILVLSRHFDEAKTEYLATLKYSHSDELNNRARTGLNKLTR